MVPAGAIEGNLAEVQMGTLAQDKNMNDRVRSFGDMLVKDHSADSEKATALANSFGITTPTEPTRAQKSIYDRLSKVSGKAFDRQFARMMVTDHKRDIKEFDKEAKSSNDQVSGFAKDSCQRCRSIWTAQSLVKAETAAK